MRPKVIDIGNAGSAFLYIESRVSVPPRPTKIDTAHARTTFQSPPTEALPTKTLQQL